MVRPRCLCKRIEHISKVPILKQPVFHILKAVSAVQRCMANSLLVPALNSAALDSAALDSAALEPTSMVSFPAGSNLLL